MSTCHQPTLTCSVKLGINNHGYKEFIAIINKIYGCFWSHLATLLNKPSWLQECHGYKFRLEDGSWLLIRFSGTEPVLRLYCESSTLDRVQEILAWAKSWATYI